MLHLT